MNGIYSFIFCYRFADFKEKRDSKILANFSIGQTVSPESCPRLISALAALHKLYRFSSMETLGLPRTISTLERGTMCNYLQVKLKCSKRYPFNLTGSDTRAKLRSKVNVKYTSI